MDITQRFKNAVAAFRTTKNQTGFDPNAYLKYGHNRMPSSWSTPEISDEDFYSGIGYAVINKRANRSVTLGKNFLFTQTKDEIQKEANDKGLQVEHPYLTLIRNSIDFAERDFWYDISTYLDLEGVYYLMAVRAVTGKGAVSNIQKFSLLNPYWVRPVINSDGQLGGYVENNPHLGNREIRKELIIPIKLLNPFDPNKTYSLADAARDSQFTIKQANDFARESINGNLNAPGILSSAIELPDDQFDNFVSRVKSHDKGEPLFGNGAGTISWVDMQTDLDKAALAEINSINRDALLAISGLSKTGIGVEESGTGREVSRTQKDDFTENAIMPQIENIIDALNLDYRKYYNGLYTQNKYNITLDNPLETDRDAEQADVEIRDTQFTLLQSLLSAGYAYEIASKYAKGLITVTDLGEPTNTPVVDPAVNPETPDKTPKGDGTDPNQPAKKPKNDYQGQDFSIFEGYPIPVLQYLGDNAKGYIPLSEQASYIYSNDSMLDMDAKVKRVHITEIIAHDNTLVAEIDETTFIVLGRITHDADVDAILSILNKRYNKQVVAVKSKLEFNHDHDDTSEVIRNAVFDKQEQIEQSTNNLLTSAQPVEDRMFNFYMDEIGRDNTDPNPNKEEFTNSLALPIAVYFTVMFGIYANQRSQQTAKELGIKDDTPIVASTDDVKHQIKSFAAKEAKSHINTLEQDLDQALSIIRAKTTDPTEMKQMFQEAYTKIRAHRSTTLANSTATKIFNLSQYEADLQFLTRAGLVKQAYKELFSLSGDPCAFCAQLIAASKSDPIPFTEAFAAYGSSLEADGQTMTFNYEAIIAGNVHPNCRCAYRLIVKD